MNRMIKKKPRNEEGQNFEESKQDADHHTVVGESESGDELLYISKRQLTEQIQRSQLLSTLLY